MQGPCREVTLRAGAGTTLCLTWLLMELRMVPLCPCNSNSSCLGFLGATWVPSPLWGPEAHGFKGWNARDCAISIQVLTDPVWTLHRQGKTQERAQVEQTMRCGADQSLRTPCSAPDPGEAAAPTQRDPTGWDAAGWVGHSLLGAAPALLQALAWEELPELGLWTWRTPYWL